MTPALTFRFTGPAVVDIFRALVATNLAGQGTPTVVKLDDQAMVPTTGRWLSAVDRAESSLLAGWGEQGVITMQKQHGVVLLRCPRGHLDPGQLVDALEEVPFELGTTDTLHPEWRDGSLGQIYEAPRFSGMHLSHGWACLFKGRGHEQLVSRRWLDFGPWRLSCGNNDLSLVQFHEWTCDAATALSQARPGHERMGISDIGGFIGSPHKVIHDATGLYYPKHRQLHISVLGREVSQREMLDICASRLYQTLGPERPLGTVAYVFMDEAEARAHLHELWLRGLECRTFVDGKEMELTFSYRPRPVDSVWSSTR